MGASVLGPICVTRVGTAYIDVGTLCLTRSRKPAPIGGESNSLGDVIQLPQDLPSRLLRAARSGLPNFSSEVRDKIADALTIENVAFLCAAIAVDMALTGTGAGVVLNVFLGGAVIVFVGLDAFAGARHLASFYSISKSARSESDYQRAGVEFAKGVTTLGVDAVIVLLTRSSGRRMNGRFSASTSEADAAGAAASSVTVLSRWSTYIRTLDLKVPANRGALWSKLFDEPSLPAAAKSALSDGNVATALATQDGRFTLESKLAKSEFWSRYEVDFPTKDGRPMWNEHTIEPIWKMLSEKYAAGLEGDIVAYIDSEEVLNAINAGKPPILTDELKIIQSQVLKNGRIKSVTFQDIWTKKRTKAISRQTLESGFKFFN